MSGVSPAFLRPTLRQRLRALWDAVVARFSANPLLFVVLGIFLLSLTAFFWTAIAARSEDHRASLPVMQIEEGTIHEAQQALKAGKVESITRSLVYKNPPILDNELLRVSVFKLKDGRQMRLDTGVLPDEFWKKVTEAADKQKFALREGITLPKERMAPGMAGMGLLYSTLILVLLMAQMLVGQVVSGHTFQPEKRDMNVKLDDVIGYEEVKREIGEIIDKIRHAPAYARKGIKAPRGLLLLGDPGVGKTMLAKAMANELGAKFFYCTGADFAEMYVGVGARRVRALFKRARKYPRSFIFIDEIDAIGARSTMGQDSERQSVINQLLAEMDGVSGNGTLLVMGATNHAHLLDPALRRAGRFDKQLHVPLPDLETREGILRHYLRGFTLSPDVDLMGMAHRTSGYSGAGLAGLVEEAKNLALREAKGGEMVISMDTLQRAQETAILGVTESRAHPDDLDRGAVHELGHALAGIVCCPDLVVEKVTVAGRGQALGYTAMRPLRDQRLRTLEALRGELIMKLGGRAAEEVVLGQVSSGAADDLEKATSLAREMVTRYGMGKRTGLMSPPRSTDPGQLSESVQEDIKELLEAMYGQAKGVMEQHREWLERNRVALQSTDTLGEAELLDGLKLNRQGFAA